MNRYHISAMVWRMTPADLAPAARDEDRALDECLSVRDGHLFMEGCDVVELAARYGTPLHLLSADQLLRRFGRLTRAFTAAWPEGPVELLPSVKANFTAAAWRLLAREGAGADVFGLHELTFARRAGVAPERISLNGPKDERAIADAVACGARITLDAISELAMARAAARAAGRPARVRFRARPDLAACQGPTDYAAEAVPIALVNNVYKAGIPTGDLLALDLASLPAEEIEVTGIHFHVGRHSPELGFWVAVVRACVDVIATLRDAWGGWTPREIDLGGGLPSPRDPFGKAIPRVAEREGAPPPVEEYARTIAGTLRDELAAHGIDAAGRTLQVEPGRATFGDAGIHLGRVLGVKRQGGPTPISWVQTDTSETFLPDATLDHYLWRVVVANRAGAPAEETADVVGMACSMDRLVGDAEVPRLEPGELLAFLDTGAYQDAVSCNRNLLGRPATVMVSGSEHRVVKRAETLDDILARDADG